MMIFSIFRQAKTLVKQGFRNIEIRNFLPKLELFLTFCKFVFVENKGLTEFLYATRMIPKPTTTDSKIS